MIMDNLRSKPFDRSNSRQQPSLKKPRLAEDITTTTTNHNFPARPPPSQPPSSGSVSAAAARFGDRDLDSNDSSRGGYQPQNLQQQRQQHQELIDQYQTALDELTSNSKPIITNLTIIAGENLLAAKAIASAICDNILEVPSDQKLPSLYLLDSIVKNIGRDYIKHFGAKLPEVFCKTYRQVESSLQSSMRHLFGTWKGVFPIPSLQKIEKELGFTKAVNGSSSGTTASRPDSKSLGQPSRIHVNPKYLEAREQLQLPIRAKRTADEISGISDEEMLARVSSIRADRPWADRLVNKQNVQHLKRETSSQYEKSSAESYGDYDYGSELSGRLGKGIGRDRVSITEQEHKKQIYGTRSSLGETLPRQRIDFDMKPKVPNLKRDLNSDMHFQPAERLASRNSDEVSRSWKTSEEDEYAWDDLNSRFMDYPAVSAIKARPGSNKLDPRNYLQLDSHHVDEQEFPEAPSLKKSQGTKLQKSAPVLTSLQKRQPSTQQPKLEQKQSVTPNKAQKLLVEQVSMDVILKSEILPKGSQPKLDYLDKNSMPSTSSAGTNVSNPLSNLLSSLVAKGLISSSSTDASRSVLTMVPLPSNSSKPIPLLSVSSVPALTSSTEVSVIKPSTKPSVTSTQSIPVDVKNLLGFEFKPDKIRAFHPSVITDLFDDLPHQCTICGLRLKLEERFNEHLEWHASQKTASESASRQWFADSGNWVSREGKTTPKTEPIDFTEETDNVVEKEMIEQQNHPMVPADEDLCLCILCSDLFEDFYCEKSDTWMFNGAVYMSQGLIVHADCMSDNSAGDLGLTDAVKVVTSDI